jgi:histidine triad (HIT) family protein
MRGTNVQPRARPVPLPLLLARTGHRDEQVLPVQSDTIYQDGRVTALIGSHQWPNNHGNVLIFPNEHFENIYDLPVDYAADIHRVARMVAIAMKRSYGCDGVSTRQHNEPSGNQDVWHYHLHVTPRYRDDGFYTTRRELMAAGERAMHAEKIRHGLAGPSESNVAPASRGTI